MLTLELVRELKGETRERRWYRTFDASWRGLFPQLPERSVLHKRTKSLCRLLDAARCWWRDLLLDPQDRRRLPGGSGRNMGWAAGAVPPAAGGTSASSWS